MSGQHKPRISKGYRYIYAPDSPSSSKSGSYKGYIFEHRYVVEQALGRKLRKDESIHHLDFNRLNNDISNLVVLSPQEHSALHHKLKGHIEKDSPMRRCIDCGATLSVHDGTNSKIRRCVKCSKLAQRKVERPECDELMKEVSEHSYLFLEKKYGVSTAAIKKWIRMYGITPPDRHKNWVKG